MRVSRRWLIAVLTSLCLALATRGAVAAGSFTRIQVLLPGETAAPGTASGKTGTPTAQTVGVPFSVSVRACDSNWNLVASATDVVSLLCSDASATLPPASSLSSGQATFSLRFNAAGTFTVFGHDQTDGTIPDGTSSPVNALALQGFQFATISQKHRYAGVADGTTITAVDASGRTVGGFGGQVHLQEITSYGVGRISPEWVTFSGGTWSGNVTMYRADETSINRGNVNMSAFLDAAPQTNGTSDPFIVHPGPAARIQIVVPGESPLPGSVSGKTGTPATQSAGRVFPVNAYSTDAYWNPVPSADQVRLTSSDAAANTPLTATLSGGSTTFSASLGTVGSQTVTISDLTNGTMQGMSSPPIQVIPSSVDHFEVGAIGSPQVAGVPVAVTIRATDATGNTIPNYAGDAVLVANTGAGSISPELVTFTNGVWAGAMVFKGAGGAVSFTCADFSAPPHTGTSNGFVVQPGPFSGVQVLLPGESPRGGTVDGREGTVTGQTAGTAFQITLRAVDDYWNLVTTVADSLALGSSDAFAGMPAHVRLTNGQLLQSVTLYRTGANRIWASDLTTPSVRTDTSSVVTVTGGSFARLLILAPGEFVAPGTPNGRAGAATDQSIMYAFTVTVLACDQWFNPVGGVSDVVHITSDDPLATLPPDQALSDGRAELSVRLARGGYNQITASDVTNSGKTASTTQVSAISSGFHLEASATPDSARAGEPFTLVVKVTNAAGSVIREINSFVTLQVRNASTPTPQPGRGTLLTTQFQLLQGQRSVTETYTFAEPIVIVAYDDAGNMPATSNTVRIDPGQPTAIDFNAPKWVGGNKTLTIAARLSDLYGNAVPQDSMFFSHLSGDGSLRALDTLTDANGAAHLEFVSARHPGHDLIRASADGITADLDLTTAFVDPDAQGGYFTNYPNPFHAPNEGTTLAWKLDDAADVTLRVFTESGDLVLRRLFSRGDPGGSTGLNEWVWDGRNGNGRPVASGGYVAFVEAHGMGETLHVIRRRIAVVR